MKKTCLIAIILCIAQSIAGQYQTRVWQPNIKTLRLRYAPTGTGERISTPVRPYLIMDTEKGLIDEDGDLNGNILEISFDEMSHDVCQYTYTLHHLNADMRESDLMSTEYVEGFTTQDITDYEHSLNTQQNYTHYRFTLPNEDMRLKASGNYAVRIYEDGDQDKVVATICFAVTEKLVDIHSSVTSHTQKEINGRYQQVNIDVSNQRGGGRNANMAGEYFIVVRQNERIDNEVFAPRPSYIETNALRWQDNAALVFEGGNEYRHFDIYSTYFAGWNVDKIRYNHTDYHAFLVPDELRVTGEYMHEFDTNGQFIINAERTDDDETAAEYMWVHWTLPMENPLFDGSIYVGGDLFQNQIDPQNRMIYDNEHQCYYMNALVKQGAYDYQYWFVTKEKGSVKNKATLQRTEGSHWQTENCYSIYVYFRPFGSRADRLVGINISSSN